MKAWSILVAASLIVASGAYARTPAIAPPFPRLTTPALSLQGLDPAPRHAVREALADARQAIRLAPEAEAAWRKAMLAAKAGRVAAAKSGRVLATSFERKPCRYRGDARSGQANGMGAMVCGKIKYEGHFHDGRPDGLVVATGNGVIFAGQYHDGRREGMGGDTKIAGGDAYEGAYSNGDRIGFGIEVDPDGVYPGRYGFYTDPLGKPHNIELSGAQDFRGSHWVGTYGFYTGRKIACTIIKGAVLEGSVLNGPGAKFDRAGRVTEQGNYRVGLLDGSTNPPC